jgi:hypothetical protein
VTAELAAGLPVLVLLLAAALTAVSAVTTQLRCVDAARETAGAAGRGDSDPLTVGRRSAPSSASITVDGDGRTVRVTVHARLRPLGWPIPGNGVQATAVAEREPGGPR